MTDGALEPVVLTLIGKLGVTGTAVVVLILLAWRLGWVTFKMPTLRRKDDQAIEHLVTIVKENTAAFVALKATMEDNKVITIRVADSLGEVHSALAGLSGQIQGALRIEPIHHREGRRAAG